MIRAALPEQAAELTALALAAKAGWGYSDDFMERCRAELSVQPQSVLEHPTFVLQTAHVCLGFYVLEQLSRTRAELGQLFVRPGHQRRGHGKRLLEHACRQARQLGYASLRIQSDPNAAGFYVECDARYTGVSPSASIPGRELPVFEIDLVNR